MSFEQYVTKGTGRLRRGYTTGSCAALGARAAAQMLLGEGTVASVSIETPAGLGVTAPVLHAERGPGYARCAIQKDGGDDADATHGMLVFVQAEKNDEGQHILRGGEGVGRVTKPGLDQPVGQWAINRTPRRMIQKELEAVCAAQGYAGGLTVTLSIPGGEAVAAKTFNPHLGIVGGLSILGTTGIVEPMSNAALIATIETEMRQRHAEGVRHLVLTPGNYGEGFLAGQPELRDAPHVKCSNFIGEALDFAAVYEFESVLLVGHAGKLVKLAGGVMNTHSSVADCRLELVALHAALAGLPREKLGEVLDAATVDEAFGFLERQAFLGQVSKNLGNEIQRHLERRVKGAYRVGALWFTPRFGTLGETSAAQEIRRLLQGGKRSGK